MHLWEFSLTLFGKSKNYHEIPAGALFGNGIQRMNTCVIDWKYCYSGNSAGNWRIDGLRNMYWKEKERKGQKTQQPATGWQLLPYDPAGSYFWMVLHLFSSFKQFWLVIMISWCKYKYIFYTPKNFRGIFIFYTKK